MNIGRIIASTVIRRLTLLALAGVLAWLGFGHARAQDYPDYPNCYPQSAGGTCPDIAIAYQMARANADYKCSVYQGFSCTWLGFDRKTHSVRGRYHLKSYEGAQGTNSAGSSFYWDAGCPPGTEWSDETNTCAEDCGARASVLWAGPSGIPNGATSCNSGCLAVLGNNGDGTYTWNYGGSGGGLTCTVEYPTGCDEAQRNLGWTEGSITWGIASLCIPPTFECTADQVRNAKTGECESGCPLGMHVNSLGQCQQDADTCPAGQIRSPSGSCLPGDGQCGVGEARKPDGTCGNDSDGDGVADDYDPDDPTSFSGGDSCDSPPSCSGDPVMCGQARIQWRIECNTRSDTKIQGGSCDTIPVCTGRNCDAMEYSQLLQQWRASCALESLSEGLSIVGGDDGGGDGDGSGDEDFDADAEGIAAADRVGAGEGGEASQLFSDCEGADCGDGSLDGSGYGYGSSCPTVPPIDVLGQTVTFNTGPMCEWLRLGSYFVLLLAALASARIIAGGV